MSVLFIAGAGTDVGKTYVTALLIRQLRAAGRAVAALKPVASGVPAPSHPDFAESDTARLLEAQGLSLSPANIDACTPWRLGAPLSPDMAAAAEGRTIEGAAVLAWCRQRIASAAPGAMVLIEGVGGIMSPFCSDALNLDVVKQLGCPVLLVGGAYLGGVSHALTAVETLKAHGVPITALIVNETPVSTIPVADMLACIGRYENGFPILPLSRDAKTLTLGLR